jgi:hypothetical protein
MRLVFLAILMSGVMSAQAANVTLSCTAPTKNTDSSPISPLATLGFNFYGGPQGQPLQLITPTPLASCTSIRTAVNPGTICYAATAVETINGVSAESAQTVPVCTMVAPPTPVTPSNLQLTVSVPVAANTAYILEKAADRLVMLPAGTVPAGTACDAGQSVSQGANTFNVVPHAVITWTGSVRSLTAFAMCS